ncbi:MAG: type I phosphomannose isomerase catalytic subunit [Bacteroidota bacterium]
MSKLYPLKFQTIFKDKIWGGQKIKSILGKDYGDLPNCGETWEISGVEGNISMVADGALKGKSLKELIGTFKGELVGQKVFERFGNEFPLLIKFLDANDDLSIQVHPDDELAKKRHDSFGKTEMWYVLQGDEGAKLVSGFNRKVDRNVYLDYFNNGQLKDILNIEVAQADDVFFIPAGRVHTIGKGLLIAEIQQTSDVTYRIYDFDRTDAQGNKRELHVEQALDAIDYDFYDSYKTGYQDAANEVVDLVECPYFSTQKLHFTETTSRDYSSLDSFVIYIGIDGALNLKFDGGQTQLKKGEAILIPASITNIELEPEGEFTILETYIP